MTISTKTIVLFKDRKFPQDSYQECFQSNGFSVYFVPVLETEILADSSPLTSALSKPEEYAGFVLTSKRACEALSRRFLLKDLLISIEKCQDHLNGWMSKPVFVVGEATAELAQSLGFSQILGKSSGNASELAKIIFDERSTFTGQRLLFLVGDKRMDTLPCFLNEHDIAFDELRVYETRANPIISSTLKTLSLDMQNAWWVFFSPSGFDIISNQLENVQELKQLQETIKIASIGATTSKRIRELGYRVDAEACKPNATSLLEALAKL